MSALPVIVRRVKQETLYSSLSRCPATHAGADPARTEYTADDRETIDRDRAVSTLYSRLSNGIAPGSGDVGRTEITRADAETVDRDHHAPHGSSALFGAAEDLYCHLGARAHVSGGDKGRTALTESTESIDWDRPPIGPWT
jgi:hypothetical protein